MTRRKLPKKEWHTTTYRIEKQEYEDFADYCYERGHTVNSMIVQMIRGKINRKNRAA